VYDADATMQVYATATGVELQQWLHQCILPG